MYLVHIDFLSMPYVQVLPHKRYELSLCCTFLSYYYYTFHNLYVLQLIVIFMHYFSFYYSVSHNSLSLSQFSSSVVNSQRKSSIFIAKHQESYNCCHHIFLLFPFHAKVTVVAVQLSCDYLQVSCPAADVFSTFVTLFNTMNCILEIDGE